MTAEDIWAVFYKNQELIEHIDQVVYYFRVQNLDKAMRMTGKILKGFSDTIPVYALIADFLNEDMVRMDVDYVVGIVNSLLAAQENQDYELLPDLYELQLLPFIKDIQEKIILMEEGVPSYNRYLYRANYQVVKEKMPELAKALNEAYIPQRLGEEGYSVEYTSSGLPTMKINRSGKEFYLHSNGHPMKEALLWAQGNRMSEELRLEKLSSMAEGKSAKDGSDLYTYVVYGIGFGYHIKALLQQDPCCQIKVYESDINILQLLCAYGDLAFFINHERVTLIYDEMCHELSAALTKNPGKFLIHYPSMQAVKGNYIRQMLENYFVQYSSVANQLQHLNGNFASNLSNYDAGADELRSRFEGKNLIIVAAGPSLDKNYELLKQVGENDIILATGTVFVKLLEAGIRPDYVIVTDASPRVVYHIREHEKETVPMILISTAAKEFARRYAGKKYLMLQKDYAPAEKMAEREGATLFETGGSVSTAALDLGIRFKCKKIIFIGLDLSFPELKAHAADTSRIKVKDNDALREVQDIHGGMVKTNKSMDIYRQWIERRIAGVTDVTLIDATEGGAMIHGMQVCPFQSVLGTSVKKRILVFKGNSKYGVMRQFTDQVIEGFRRANCEVEIFDAKIHTGEDLNRMVAKKYDCVFSFNGVFTGVDLPEEVIGKLTSDGRNLCISHFVDHPCHHDQRLRKFPPNHLALFTDRDHVSFVNKYFPEIKAEFLPHGGDRYEGLKKPYKDRTIDVLFSGSCRDEAWYKQQMEQMDEAIAMLITESLKYLSEHTEDTVEQAMKTVLAAQGIAEADIDFSEEGLLQVYRFIDDLIRRRMREQIVTTLAESGCHVTICGSGWEEFEKKYPEQITHLGNLSYEKTNEMMADAKIVLNVMPWFKDGSHERVFTAMRNGAVCLTDESRYLKETLNSYKSVGFFSLSEISKLPEKIRAFLAVDEQGSVTVDGTQFVIEEALKESMETAEKCHTWEKNAEWILNRGKKL